MSSRKTLLTGRSRLWIAAVLTAMTGVACGQCMGDWTEEDHPRFRTWQCSTESGCKAYNTSLVLDENYRFFHVRGSSISCKTNKGTIDLNYCDDEAICSQNCVLEGANYADAGITTWDNGTDSTSMRLNIAVDGHLKTPRLYLLDESGINYQSVKLDVGMEIAYDVDMSETRCSSTSAIYLVDMERDGGRSAYNPAGAYMGTGYCDAQCYVKNFINGQANVNGSGVCCGEVDFWEADNTQFRMAPHPCRDMVGVHACNGTDCNNADNGGRCSKNFCNYSNLDRADSGDYTADDVFYGPGKIVDTKRPFTVIIQLMGDSSMSELASMRAVFIQDGKVIRQDPRREGFMEVASCSKPAFAKAGGLANTLAMMQRGMVLAFSLWSGNQDYLHNDPEKVCQQTNVPATTLEERMNTNVVISNVRWGDINSTFKEDGSHWLS